ncbi:MAG: hypothetical protein WC563_16085 [Brevundimonas sp.]
MPSDCAHKRADAQAQNRPGLRKCAEDRDMLAEMNQQPRLKRGKSLPEEQSEIVRGFLRESGCVAGKYSEFGRRLGYHPSAIERLMKGAGASADMVDAIHRRMKINLAERINRGRVTASPNLTKAIKIVGEAISPEAVARVLYSEHPDDRGSDASVEWWSQRLHAEQTIVRLLSERDRPIRVKK